MSIKTGSMSALRKTQDKTQDNITDYNNAAVIKPAYQDERTTLYHSDCIETMRQMPAKSVDLVFADPPYNLQLNGRLYRPDQSLVSSVDEDWDRFESFEEYDRFTRSWLKAARRILKTDGSLWVIGSYHNIFRVGRLLQDLGFWILNDVIWIKNNPMPNFRGTRFTNAHETMIWASRDKQSPYHFAYDSLKAANDDIQVRSDWYMPICSGSERIKDEEHKKTLHPTQKPEQLLHRIIMSTSRRDAVICDPFMGSGTTGAVARKLRRRFIGIDSMKNYVRAAQKRITKTKLYDEDVFAVFKSEGKKARRIPFGTLVERGVLPAGSKLYYKESLPTARIQADGSLVCKSFSGSIHRVGALLTGKESCNGWTFWHYHDECGTLKPIDFLRQKIRSALACD